MALLRTVRTIIGVASAYTLESTYTGAGISAGYYIGNEKEVALDVDYTMGAAETSNSIQLLVEYANPDLIDSRSYSPVSTDWRLATEQAVTAGAVTVTKQEFTFAAISAAATYDRIHVKIGMPNASWIRVSIKETGVASNKGSAVVRLVTQEEESHI